MPPRKSSPKTPSSTKKPTTTRATIPLRVGTAKPHGELVNNLVHVFVDDQNLFWGLVNESQGRHFRIDFGSLLLAAARDPKTGMGRGVATAYIAGVIPDDDSFWKMAEDQGFKVLRGFLGMGGRSKQDDAYLTTKMVATLYKQPGPSTIVLVAGDADYGPPLEEAQEKGWRVEVATERGQGVSAALDHVVHEFRRISAAQIEQRR